MAPGPSRERASGKLAADPTVSVIVAVYNAENCIAAALNSVLKDQETDLEIVVVDDASQDATRRVVAELARSDNRIQLIGLCENGGPSRARNAALAEARGEWIAVLDADDKFLPGRLQRLLRVAGTWEADIVADNVAMVDGATGRIFDTMFGPDRLPGPTVVSAETFVRGNLARNVRRKLGHLKPLFKRAFLKRGGIRYNEEACLGEDFLFTIDCLVAGARFVVIPDAGYAYTLSDKGLSQSRSVDMAAMFLRQCEMLLSRPEVAAVEGLCQALAERSREERSDIEYLRFGNAIKSRQFLRAFRVPMERPTALPYIVMQAMRVTKLRLHRWAAAAGVPVPRYPWRARGPVMRRQSRPYR